MESNSILYFKKQEASSSPTCSKLIMISQRAKPDIMCLNSIVIVINEQERKKNFHFEQEKLSPRTFTIINLYIQWSWTVNHIQILIYK